MSTAAPVKLICPECHRENEPERLYCHDCGTRLDHSSLANLETGATESAEEMHKRVSSMFDGRRDRTKALVRKWVKLILGAAVAALLVLMLLPPSLPAVKKSEEMPPSISLDLEGMTSYHKPAVLRYTDEGVNAYAAYVLKKKENLNHLLLDFERAVFKFHPGAFEITVGRSVFGYALYTSEVYAVQTQSGKFTVIPISGAIGRLPIHPALLRYTDFLFGDVVAALDRERKLLARVGNIDLRDKEVVFAP